MPLMQPAAAEAACCRPSRRAPWCSRPPQALAPLRRRRRTAAYPLLRILTPLIKFRACRDARKVTGDAMEVRGGCGYIEEWSDPRLVRDAHLGSIWEGTSNIVALDVMRADHARELAAGAAGAFRRACSTTAPWRRPSRAALRDALARAAALAATAAHEGGDVLARQAASALYHACSAIAMAWEGARSGSPQRIAVGPAACCCTACCRAIRWRRTPCRAGWNAPALETAGRHRLTNPDKTSRRQP